MNLFLIALNATDAVKDLCDKHVVKMILETAQLLYGAWHARYGGFPPDATLDALPGYKKTHVNHPVSVWVRSRVYHYQWTCMYGILLCKEYTHRYGKEHKTEAHLHRLYRWGFPDQRIDPPVVKKTSKEWITATEGIPAHFEYFPLCMDEASYVREKDGGAFHAVRSYRKYYRTKQDKFKMAWTNSTKPAWF